MDNLDERREKLLKTLSDNVDTPLKQLYDLWKECGFNEDIVSGRELSVVQNVRDIFQDMVKEEEGNKDDIVAKIEQQLQLCAQLQKELQLDISTDGIEHLPLYDVSRHLDKILKEHKDMKENRLLRYKNLQEREKDVCAMLGIPQMPLFQNPVPTHDQLKRFETYVKDKEEEKEQLLCTFHNTRENILSLMQQLDIKPATEFEKVLYSDDFILSKENMCRIKELHQKYERCVDEAKLTSIQLWEKLKILWEFLNEDQEYQNIFIQGYPGFKKSSLDALRLEIERCEKKKRQNIEMFIRRVREELVNLWDQCFIGEKGRHCFSSFHSKCFSEDLLELHELEVKKLRDYYQTNSNILHLLAEYKNLWDKIMEIENKALNKDRLFQNRGGQLLREEKERRTVQKKLPKIEDQIKKYAASYKERTGSPFMYFDEVLEDYLERQHNQYKEHKEQGKMARKRGRDQTDSESRPCSRTMTMRSKCLRSNTPTPLQQRNVAVKESSTGVQSMVRRKIDTTRTICTTTEPTELTDCNISYAPSTESTYSDFQNHLENLNKKETCRSSVLPQCLLKDHNVQDKIPIRRHPATPAKPPRKNLPVSSHLQKEHQFLTPQITPRRLGKRSPAARGYATTPRLTSKRGRLPLI